MRPYLAVIKDSFREAIHSRVLWILLIVITLFLLLIAPAGYRVTLTTTFNWTDVQDARQLVERLSEKGQSITATREKRIWELIHQPTREDLQKFARVKEVSDRDYMLGKQKLVQALNELLLERGLHDPELWPAASLSKEARDLAEKPRQKLSTDELGRLNRILIESALPGQFAYRSAESVRPTYLGFVLIEQFPFSKTQTEMVLRDWILPWTMQIIVGMIGILTAVLVTSPIVPQMFEPGSINLLLSKPVSRSLLFFSKFIGGCAFILLCSGYLILGLWLIVGYQTGIWNRGMLWCVPVFMFLFLIYYAVSALAGVIWKSAVVSVVVSAVFWIICLFADTTTFLFDEQVRSRYQIVRVVEADETTIAVLERGQLFRWNGDERSWQEIGAERRRDDVLPKTIGPFFHEKTGQLVLGTGWRMPLGFGQPTLQVKLSLASEGWQMKAGPSLPDSTATFFFDPQQSLLAVNSEGVHRLPTDPAPPKADIKVLGFSIPLGTQGFQRASDDSLKWDEPLDAAIHPQSGVIAVYSRGKVQRVSLDEGKKRFIGGEMLELEGDPAQGVAIAYAGNTVVVARADGTIWVIDAATWKVRSKFSPDPDTQPRFLTADPNGKWFAVLNQNNYLWLIDAAAGTIKKAPVRGQGDISAVAFGSQGMLVADRIHRVTTYDLEHFARRTAIGPPLSVIEMIYYYGITPVYTVFPKPRLLDQTVNYLITGKETQDWGVATGDLELKRDNLRPWRPVKSSLAFVLVVLVIACIYIERHEF
ncbi:MAG TPA: ABC transporter permease subunit [Pirellulaceae bacterium]|nr:ABC transporter permease subunit [Pirellulaceae bacterium]